jgi:hypothetical protein
MGDDKIIRFPGGASDGKRGEPEPPPPGAEAAAQLEGLDADQRKAIGIILSGMPFVLVGIKPTQSGADFFTALAGDAADLRNARPHLEGVIDRAFGRKGI